jgi:hypothetical protein
VDTGGSVGVESAEGGEERKELAVVKVAYHIENKSISSQGIFEYKNHLSCSSHKVK